MITPTIGGIVWFHPSEPFHIPLTYHDNRQPLAAIVAYVWNDRMVNLTVFDQNGAAFPMISVKLFQDGDPAVGSDESWAEWMPYQKGQAAKYEQLEKEKANA